MYASCPTLEMESMEGPIDERSSMALPTSKLFQSSHSHIYTSSQKQKRPRHKESHNQETQEKASRRASKQVPSNTDTGFSQLRRRTSRIGLFGLFIRNKAPEGSHLENGLNTPWEGDDGGKYEQRNGVPELSGAQIFAPDQDSQPAQPQNIPLRCRASKRALKTKESFTRELNIKKPTVWEPPPLFQAYPQAVKHATLEAPTLAPEVILRVKQERQSAYAKNTDAGEAFENPKKQKEKKLKKASASEIVSKRDWTEKVYVLVTEGYLLQYAGHGSHDRSPERVMPLSKDSAAFACDAITGKPYVLQISQISDEGGTVNPEVSKSMLKKAGLKGEMKRSASTFLLVMQGPEEMNAWLVAIRKEIEALGGKEYKPEVFGTEGLEGKQATKPGQQIQRMPSQRYLVKREPHRFSRKPWEPIPNEALGEDISPEEKLVKTSEVPLLVSNRYSLATQDSANTHCISDTTASIDQVHLDRLRESSRQSYASTVPKTASTSRCSSMERSSVAGKFDEKLETNAAALRRSSANRLMHRASMQQKPIDMNDRDLDRPTPTPSPRPALAVTGPTDMRTVSPTAPNFSVPTFSKRYSMNNSSPVTSIKPQTPPASIKAGKHIPQPNMAIYEVDSQCDSGSLVGEILFRPTSSSRASKRSSTSSHQNGLLGSPPKSSDPNNPARSRVGFSRRQSSLDYAKGICPIKLPNHSPSPHPPPTTALPPVPDRPDPKRASLIPAPTGSPLPIPDAGRKPTSGKGPAALELTAESGDMLSPPSFNHAQPHSATTHRQLRRQLSMQVGSTPSTLSE